MTQTWASIVRGTPKATPATPKAPPFCKKASGASDSIRVEAWCLFILNNYVEPLPPVIPSKDEIRAIVSRMSLKLGPNWYNEIPDFEPTMPFFHLREQIIFVELLLVWHAIVLGRKLVLDEESEWNTILKNHETILRPSINRSRLIEESHKICVENNLHGAEAVSMLIGTFWENLMDTSLYRDIREIFPQIPEEFLPKTQTLWANIIRKLFVFRSLLGDNPSMWRAIIGIARECQIEDEYDELEMNRLLRIQKETEFNTNKTNMSAEEFEEWIANF